MFVLSQESLLGDTPCPRLTSVPSLPGDCFGSQDFSKSSIWAQGERAVNVQHRENGRRGQPPKKRYAGVSSGAPQRHSRAERGDRGAVGCGGAAGPGGPGVPGPAPRRPRPVPPRGLAAAAATAAAALSPTRSLRILRARIRMVLLWRNHFFQLTERNYVKFFVLGFIHG